MGLYKRKYNNYQQYLDHQREKLSKKLAYFQETSEKRLEGFIKRLRDISPKIPGNKVLCLAARLGEEVKAFRELGHSDAIGIDLNPGPDNEYVIEGDFHDIPFGNAEFNGVYCNCLDHAWDLRKISIEAARVLKPDGILVLDVPYARTYKKRNHRHYRKKVKKESKYEVTLWDSLDDVINEFQEFYEVYERIPSGDHRIVVFMQKN